MYSMYEGSSIADMAKIPPDLGNLASAASARSQGLCGWHRVAMLQRGSEMSREVGSRSVQTAAAAAV